MFISQIIWVKRHPQLALVAELVDANQDVRCKIPR
nr:MAG TPA: hypothetical protein [Caudoviricetes sp.]